jgi:Tfp pilus assembly protein PilN
VLRRVIQEDPKPLRRINPSIPADLETIVGKAMAKLPADRYPTAQALADDLRRFLEDKPILARRPSLLEKAARWSRRRRGLVAAGIGVLLLAVCGLTASTLLFNWQMGKTQKAYDLLSKEEGRKEEALRAEAQQRRRAEQSAWKARQVLNYFTQESEEAIPDRQELQPVRRRLLEAALGYYKDFIEQQGDDPSVQAEMIASKLRVASILDEIGQKPDARAIREEVRAELRALGAAAPPGVFSGLGESAFLVSRLLTQSAVQQDLKLSDEQLQSIRALTALRDDPPTHPSNDDQPETAEKAWFAVLRPEQADRLRQIVWQQRGGHAFADADVADALGLNADQRERIHRIDEDAYRDFSPKHWGKYSESYWKGIGDQLLNVLTEEQKAKWKTMTGEPFHGEIHFGGPPTTLLPASPLEPPKQPD